MLSQVTAFWTDFRKVVLDLGKVAGIRFDRSPIDSVETLTVFVQTRSSYVAQTSLLGYLKTRMGTQFRVLFVDEVYSTAIREASEKIFVSCLGDLTVFAIANVATDDRLDADQAADLARGCFADALERAFADDQVKLDLENARAEFDHRTRQTNWANSAVGEDAFAGSGMDIIRHAPVIDEFKQLDQEIVTNSIRFRWIDVREEFRRRLDADRVAADWRGPVESDTAD